MIIYFISYYHYHLHHHASIIIIKTGNITAAIVFVQLHRIAARIRLRNVLLPRVYSDIFLVCVCTKKIGERLRGHHGYH